MKREVLEMAGKKKNTGEDFDYSEAVAELEKIAAKVEDPGTGIDDIDAYIRKADALIARCRKYLRTAREKAESMETI